MTYAAKDEDNIINVYYRLKDGINPYKSITVYYVDEDGNAIDDPYVVKNVPVNTSVTKWAGDEANKREYLYDEIYTEDGLYEFVTYAAKDEDNIINVYYRLKGATDPEDPDDPDNSGNEDSIPPYIPSAGGNSNRDDSDRDDAGEETTVIDENPIPEASASVDTGNQIGDAVKAENGPDSTGGSIVIDDSDVPLVNRAPQTGRQAAGSLALLAGAAVVATLTLRRKKK